MNNMKRFVLPLAALVMGIILIVMGCISMSQVKNFPEIEAVVTNVEREYFTDEDGTREEITVRVKYTINGVDFEEVLQNNTADLHEGDEITVRYNPEKPSFVTGATKSSSMIPIGFGALFTLIGLVLFAKSIIRGR